MMRVTHRGGPLDGADASLAAPRTPRRLFWAEPPDGVPSMVIVGTHFLVGYDDPPERPWPGQCEYALDREQSDLRPHPQYDEMEVGTAVFVFVSEDRT